MTGARSGYGDRVWNQAWSVAVSLYDAASVTHKYFSVSLLVYTLRLSSRIRASSEMINSSKNVSLLKAEQGLETSEKEGIFFYSGFILALSLLCVKIQWKWAEMKLSVDMCKQNCEMERSGLMEYHLKQDEFISRTGNADWYELPGLIISWTRMNVMMNQRWVMISANLWC